MDQRHILHVIKNLDPGDASDALLQLVRSADPLSIRSTIICLVDSVDMAADAGSAQVIILGRAGRGAGSLAFLALLAEIRELKPDIVQTWDYSAILIGTIAQRLCGVGAPSLIWTLHAMPPANGIRERFLPSVLALFTEWAEAIIVRSFEIMHAHAPLGFHSRDWRRIPFFAPRHDPRLISQQRQSLRRQLGANENMRLIVQVVNANWKTDLQRFFGAVRALRKSEDGLVFAVTGPAAIVNSPEIGAAFLSFGNEPAIQRFADDDTRGLVAFGADVIVSPGGIGGALSNLAVMAMAQGVPCITDLGGNSELPIGDSHLMVLPGDAAALAGVVRRLLHLSQVELNALCEFVRDRTAGLLGMNIILGRYGALCEQLYNRRQDRLRAAAERALLAPSQTWLERQIGRLAELLGMRGRVPVRSLAGTVLLVAMMTAIGRSATFVREVMVAATFGTGPELEAYFLALAIPTFLTVSATAAIPAAYARIASAAAPAEAPFVLGRMTMLFGLVAVTLTAVLTFLAPYYMAVLGRGLPAQTTAVAVRLVPWVCAIIPSQLWIALWTVALNLRGRFAWPALLSAITPFGVVVALVLATGDATAETLANGTAFGALAETIVIGLMAFSIGIRFQFFRSGLVITMGQIGWEISTVVLGTLTLGSVPLADQVVSAQVGPGAVGAFFLGSKIVASITGISAIALSQAVIPRISLMASGGDRLAVLALARNTIVLVILIGLIASGAVAAFSADIVEFVFARGRFGAAETAAVAAAQAAYAWHIAPFLAWVVTSRILVTLGASRVVLVLSVIASLVNLAMDLLVMQRFGVPGIALTTAVSYSLVMILGLLHLRRTILTNDQGP